MADRSDTVTVEELIAASNVIHNRGGQPCDEVFPKSVEFWCTGCLARELALRLKSLRTEAERLREALTDARGHLLYAWQRDGACPCGARLSSIRTHPHVTGCPTAAAVAAQE